MLSKYLTHTSSSFSLSHHSRIHPRSIIEGLVCLFISIVRIHFLSWSPLPLPLARPRDRRLHDAPAAVFLPLPLQQNTSFLTLHSHTSSTTIVFSSKHTPRFHTPIHYLYLLLHIKTPTHLNLSRSSLPLSLYSTRAHTHTLVTFIVGFLSVSLLLHIRTCYIEYIHVPASALKYPLD
ncbi:hypothetical protein BC629DRAFT_376516 [Irpex lacteus]|nr:hypothetical protein BC629DRAFT_376516 [Irpex lacteus]